MQRWVVVACECLASHRCSLVLLPQQQGGVPGRCRAHRNSALQWGSTTGSLGSYCTTGPSYESQFIAEGINPVRHCKPPSTARSSRRPPPLKYDNDLGGTQSLKPPTSRPGTGRSAAASRPGPPMTSRARSNISELSKMHTPEPSQRPHTSRVHVPQGGATTGSQQRLMQQAQASFNSKKLKEWRRARDAGKDGLHRARKQQMYGPLTTRTPPVNKRVPRNKMLASAGRAKVVSRGPWQAQAPLVVFD